MEDGLSSFDEWAENIAFLVLHALLVYLPLHHLNRLVDYFAGILQSNGQVEAMRFSSQEGQVVDRVSSGEAESIVVVVSIHVIRIHPITAVFGSEGESIFHDPTHVGGIRIQPELSRPAVELLTVVGLLKLIGVRPEVLVAAGREVANDTSV